MLKSLCTWAVGVMNEVWHFSSSNKNQRKFHGVQCPLKKADKSKPLHPNFRLFSKQPTTDKKGWQRHGAVSLSARFLHDCKVNMNP